MVTRNTDPVFRAVADPTRRGIIAALSAGPRAVHDLAASLPISRPAVSKHLRILGDAGLVTIARRGKENLYVLDPAPLAELSEWLHSLWAEKLSALKHLVEGSP